MTTETDLTVAVATEIAKQLPVKDVLSPPARQAGEIFQDIVKTVQLALAPIQLAGALQDRLRHFIDNSIRKVPEGNRVSPAPQILGPTIEAIRYEPEGTEIDAMFSELLSASMDDRRVKDAHPAFATIIRSLSPDEAKLLKAIAIKPIRQTFTQALDPVNNLFAPAVIESLEVPPGLAFPENARAILAHLVQLGLTGEEPQVGKPAEPLYTSGRQTGLRMHIQFHLTIWGRQFMRAATPLESLAD
ncbi:hypothetical protein ACVW1A_007168 [Bradyrhizobium sp. LB1.3]